jgi:hypothetical protein
MLRLILNNSVYTDLVSNPPWQMAVAVYFLDKLALRAGHEKDDDEADTVGCCTLKVSWGSREHSSLKQKGCCQRAFFSSSNLHMAVGTALLASGL